MTKFKTFYLSYSLENDSSIFFTTRKLKYSYSSSKFCGLQNRVSYMVFYSDLFGGGYHTSKLSVFPFQILFCSWFCVFL